MRFEVLEADVVFSCREEEEFEFLFFVERGEGVVEGVHDEQCMLGEGCRVTQRLNIVKVLELLEET